MTTQAVPPGGTAPNAPLPASRARFFAMSAAAAAVAASAAHASTLITVPVWAMFVGWVAFYTRGHSAREGVANLLCLALGIALGLIASVAVGMLHPSLGSTALPLVVLIVALLVISLRAVPMLNNILSYFLGLITVFAAHAEPGIAAFAELATAGALGGFAAWLASVWQGWIAQRSMTKD
jgi:hypothetical protein